MKEFDFFYFSRGYRALKNTLFNFKSGIDKLANLKINKYNIRESHDTFLLVAS